MHTKHQTKNTKDLVTRIKMMEDQLTASTRATNQVRNTSRFKFLDRLGSLLMKADSTGVAFSAPSFPIVFGAVRTTNMAQSTSLSFETIYEASFTLWNPNVVVGGYVAADAGSTGEVRVTQLLADDTQVVNPLAVQSITTSTVTRWTIDFGPMTNATAGGVATVRVQLRRTSGAGTIYVSVTECRTNSDELLEPEI